MKTINEIKTAIENEKTRSAWDKAVKAYALELVYGIPQDTEYNSVDSLKTAMLNGADSWSKYSYGGCSLIYDADIAERTCTPSELKKVKGGENRPNANEEWLDVQARALTQAARMIIRLAK